MGKAADAAARAAANRADDAEANAHRAHESATGPTRRPMTPTARPLNYGNKPKPSTTRPGLSVNAQPSRQTRTKPA